MRRFARVELADDKVPDESTLWVDQAYRKTRYRGIAKNLARPQTPFALANLYAVRQRLLPPKARAAL